MSCVKLMIDNFITLSRLVNSDVSSQQSAFPVTNAYNLNRRSKVWRSQGSFVVTSSNQAIIFREAVAGIDKTALIAIASYTSAAAFAAAVKTALDAAGLATYTVTQNSNFKFVITSNLGGGATAFELRTANVLFTAADMLGFDDSVHNTGASSYISDFLRINTGEWILWDMGIPTNPMHFMMTGPRNSALTLSPGGTFRLQGNHTNNFTNAVYDKVLTYDSEVIAEMSDAGLASTPLRYWRISFDDQNPQGFIEIGAFFLGNSFEPTRGSVQFPFDSDYVDRSQTSFSEGGQTTSEIKPQTQGFKLKWFGLTKEDIDVFTDFFRTYGTVQPFFVSLDSKAAFTVSVNKMIKFVKFVNEPKWSLVSPNNYSMDMDIREEL